MIQNSFDETADKIPSKAAEETIAQKKNRINCLTKRIENLNNNGSIEAYLKTASEPEQVDFKNLLHEIFYEDAYGEDSIYAPMAADEIALNISQKITSGKMASKLQSRDEIVVKAIDLYITKIEKFDKKLTKNKKKESHPQKRTGWHKASNITTFLLYAGTAGCLLTGLVLSFNTAAQVKPSSSSAPQYTHYVVTQSDPLNVRRIPHLGSPMETSLPKGYCVVVEGRPKNDWVKVAGLENGVTGYVASQYLRKMPFGYRCPN